mgnify:CR=1 FL=1
MMDLFRQDLLKKLGESRFAKIEKARIGIAGAGGLGSNCAACLVRVGFRNFTIADFEEFCRERQIRIHTRIALDTEEGRVITEDANARADMAIFVISR